MRIDAKGLNSRKTNEKSDKDHQGLGWFKLERNK